MKSIPQNAPVQLTFFNLLDQTTAVTCLICGKQVQTITIWHLRMHGLTINEYKSMFPGVSMASQAMRDKVRTALSNGTRPGITKNCEVCEKSFYVSPCNIKNARFCSRQCQGKGVTANRPDWGHYPHQNHLPVMCGSDNPQWRGGRDKNYYGPNWHSQRRLARQRDNHTCQKCGKTEQKNGRKLDVHHITDFREFGLERYEEANQLSNLITLCWSCHSHITGRTTT